MRGNPRTKLRLQADLRGHATGEKAVHSSLFFACFTLKTNGKCLNLDKKTYIRHETVKLTWKCVSTNRGGEVYEVLADGTDKQVE